MSISICCLDLAFLALSLIRHIRYKTFVLATGYKSAGSKIKPGRDRACRSHCTLSNLCFRNSCASSPAKGSSDIEDDIADWCTVSPRGLDLHPRS